MVQTSFTRTHEAAADHMISRFGVPRLAAACGKHPSVIRRWACAHEKGGQGGLVNARAQVSIIEMAIAAGERLDLSELFPSELIARLKASNDRIGGQAEEAA